MQELTSEGQQVYSCSVKHKLNVTNKAERGRHAEVKRGSLTSGFERECLYRRVILFH